MSKSRSSRTKGAQSNRSTQRRVTNSRKTNVERYKKNIGPSLKSWKRSIPNYDSLVENNSDVQCGWGRVIFANTFKNAEKVLDSLNNEKGYQRDIAFYVTDPHVITAISPNDVFLDPSHTFRIWFENYRSATNPNQSVTIRRAQTKEDFDEVNKILSQRKMVPIKTPLAMKQRNSRKVINLVAETSKGGEIVGFVTGIDHTESFKDPENGSSLWSLAVDPNCKVPGVGEALVRYLIEYFIARGNSYLDLSVMHHNAQAIKLYDKIGFERVSVYSVKRKNVINEQLFTPKKLQKSLNPYGQIIIDEAFRRGITVNVIDKDSAMFELSYGGRRIKCRESLSDQTSAFSMSVCADKRVTQRLLKKNGIRVPIQWDLIKKPDGVTQFLNKHNSVVLKPATGEQGRSVIVGLTTRASIKKYYDLLKIHHNDLILEEMVHGEDIRVIVINGEVVAAAKRVPPSVMGDGKSTIEKLIKKLSRRRHQATAGESSIPIDDETERVLKAAGKKLSSVLKNGEELTVRKTANLHTGGIIVDITDQFPDYFRDIAVKAASILDIPVVGLDFMIPDLNKKKYWIIEANERPGLANHEPQPTAEKFVDFLFPTTKKEQNYERFEN